MRPGLDGLRTGLGPAEGHEGAQEAGDLVDRAPGQQLLEQVEDLVVVVVDVLGVVAAGRRDLPHPLGQVADVTFELGAGRLRQGDLG
jgi:hypothetical protein